MFEYELVDQEDRQIATARTVQVMYDYASNLPVPILEDFKRLVAACEGLATESDS